MAVKVQLNGVKKSIFKPSKPFITFINGTKKKLQYGYTFINGIKTRLWGFADVKFDFVDVSSSTGLMYIDDEICGLVTTDGQVNTPRCITLMDITNINNTYLIGTYTWGRTTHNAVVQSSNGKLYYYATYAVASFNNSSDVTWSKIEIDTNTKNVTVSESSGVLIRGGGYDAGPRGAVKGTNGWLSMYVSGNVYLNSTKKYTTSIISGNKSYINGSLDGESLLFIATNGNTINKATSTSAASYLSNVGFTITDIFCDSDDRTVLTGWQGWAIYDGTTLLNGNIDSDVSDYKYTVLGRIDTYYYIIGSPASSACTKTDKVLLIINRSNGQVYQTTNLPELQYLPYAYGEVKVIPFDGSNKGYLGCCLANNANMTLRIQGA